MYYLNDFCCICLNNDDHLITLSEKDEDGLTYFQKLTDCVPEMNSEEIDPDKFICVGCIDGLDEVYYFRMMCIENKIVFLDYLTKLTSVGEQNGYMDVKVIDIHEKEKKKLKKQTKTKENVAKSNFHKKIKLSLEDGGRQVKKLNIKQEYPIESTSENLNGNPEISDKQKLYNNSKIPENDSGSFGNNSKIFGNDSEMIRLNKDMIGSGSKMIGSSSESIGSCSKSIGSSSESIGSCSKSIGSGSKSIGSCSKSIGSCSKSIGSCSKSIGSDSNSIGSGSKMIGSSSKMVQDEMIEKDSKMLGHGSEIPGNDSVIPDNTTALNNDPANLSNDTNNFDNDTNNLINDPSPQYSNPTLLNNSVDDAPNIYSSSETIKIKQEVDVSDNQIEIKQEMNDIEICENPIEIKQEMIEDESKENNVNNSVFNDVIPDKIGAKLMQMTLNDDEMFLPRENDYEDNQMSTSSCSNNSLESKTFHSKMEQDTCLKPMNVPIKRISSSKEILCKSCEQTFEDRKLLETHVCKDNVTTQLDCKYCYKHFKTPNDLCEHLCDGYEQNNLFRCDICNVIFPTQLKLVNHQNVRHGAIKHQCRICEKGFGHLMQLRDHLTNEHRVKPHICDICNKSYVHPRDLKTHINRHKGWKPFNCRLCNRDFFGKGELRRHMKSHK